VVEINISARCGDLRGPITVYTDVRIFADADFFSRNVSAALPFKSSKNQTVALSKTRRAMIDQSLLTLFNRNHIHPFPLDRHVLFVVECGGKSHASDSPAPAQRDFDHRCGLTFLMRKVNMRSFRGAYIVLFLITRLCYGQDASSSDPKTIRQLVQQVRELQDKVKALEAQRATPSAADTVPANPSASQASTLATGDADHTVQPPFAASEGIHEVHGIQWRGFGEMQREAVIAFPGAIALMDAQDIKPGVKVVKVKGLMPDEAAYPLH
jgi:hypothetical protein